MLCEKWEVLKRDTEDIFTFPIIVSNNIEIASRKKCVAVKIRLSLLGFVFKEVWNVKES